MEKSKLKIVNISSKGFKKELIVSSKDVSTLHTFLKRIIKGHLMLINTNLGLDVYYHAAQNYQDLVFNTFLLLVTSKGKSADHYLVKSLDSELEIERETQLFFKNLVKNPLLFKSYSSSLFNQLNLNYAHNAIIIDELLELWLGVLAENGSNKIWLEALEPFISKFSEENSLKACQIVSRRLIQESLHIIRSN
ncbi:hypothetical protein [Snuella sedimenti]|uniref:Uncharacterized protein n=1 Tax=Snuella sedimenti TaxID=2798802 RepID=A0A8J7J2Y0_9FLAO|nr:hypothetical protein [Snuella sedimenti]MBJ6368752.1 hypothetical protein [Snuella sedimenti]